MERGKGRATRGRGGRPSRGRRGGPASGVRVTGLKGNSRAPDASTEIATLKTELQALFAKEDGTLGTAPTHVPSTFADLPVSWRTKQGLAAGRFVSMTEIQQAAIPLALAGRDILGGAKTGSGKTLSFLVPVLERLYKERWTAKDGLGALIISPTRELAAQIFDVLRLVGGKHDLSAGLIIGGKDLKQEQARIGTMNILVCTPGRLLQHMDQTPGFDWGELRILVIDEADRTMDMGFAGTMDAVLANLPREGRQTLMFSATLTHSVSALARLSLTDPEHVLVHEAAAAATPLKLSQHYIECALSAKVNLLFSFLKSHARSKLIVFLSTCKQVRFCYESFKRLKPGVPLMCLHGRMKQPKRMAVFYSFCNKDNAALLCTDIAARGLDFPAVDWVVQADCPEDADMYIHRVGRTARFEAGGRALLIVMPSEKPMLKTLADARIPLKEMRVQAGKIVDIENKLQALMLSDPELRTLGQKSFVSYVRSVFLNPRKDVFDVSALPLAEYAKSIGLPGTPKVKFATKMADSAGVKPSGDDRGDADAGSDAGDSSDDGEGSSCGDDAEAPAPGASGSAEGAGRAFFGASNWTRGGPAEAASEAAQAGDRPAPVAEVDAAQAKVDAVMMMRRHALAGKAKPAAAAPAPALPAKSIAASCAVGGAGERAEDDDFFSLKRRIEPDDPDHETAAAEAGGAGAPDVPRPKRLKISKDGSGVGVVGGKLARGVRGSALTALPDASPAVVRFDDDGNPVGQRDATPAAAEPQRRQHVPVSEREARLRAEDDLDKKQVRARLKEKRIKRKEKEKAAALPAAGQQQAAGMSRAGGDSDAEAGGEVVVTLGSPAGAGAGAAGGGGESDESGGSDAGEEGLDISLDE